MNLNPNGGGVDIWKDEYSTLIMKFNNHMKELKLEKKLFKRIVTSKPCTEFGITDDRDCYNGFVNPSGDCIELGAAKKECDSDTMKMLNY